MCAGNSKERDVDLSTALLHEASPVVHSSTQKVRNPPVSFRRAPNPCLTARLSTTEIRDHGMISA